ncbi:MAG: chitobiase/beta-hexosaminidase C-terminal domain-containing protein [Maribacter sp.]|uniref:chitobiase/beta-hexosaminidase C-terminal domain-containing protein n=1 Tax=Maribacter sp. TaxID=1897614 RepID=UPI003C74EDFF
MRAIFFLPLLVILGSCTSKKGTYEASGTFQLAPPLFAVDSALFKNAATFTLQFGFPESQIRYTLDGKDVDGHSAMYTAPIQLKHSATLKAKAFHPDFRASDQVSLPIEKLVHDISKATVTLTPPPHDNYKGSGAQGLVDMQKGGLQFSGSNAWMGFQGNPITITIDLNNELELSFVKVSTLQNQGGWIFAPQKIEVLSGTQEIGKITIESAEEQQDNQLAMIAVPLKKGTYSQLTLQVYPLDEIPQWHQGKGTAPWLFMDEILVE